MTTSSENNMDLLEISSRIYSIKEGTGPPIILIHGLAASVNDWKDLMPELTRAGYSSFALDLPGHGHSPKPDQADIYNIQNIFACFSAWIKSLHLNQPMTLVGHSLGAYIALQYASQYPSNVSALVLCDPLYSPDQLSPLTRINYPDFIFTKNLYGKIPAWITKSLVDLASLSIRNGYQLPEDVRAQTTEDYRRIQPAVFLVVRSLNDLTPLCSKINQPTICLWGENDLSLPPKSFRKILRLIPNSKGTAIQGAGHVPHQTHPAEFNQKVLDFLRNNINE
jgi:pimeloyl-ACP methyl ester carboxylesterase